MPFPLPAIRRTGLLAFVCSTGLLAMAGPATAAPLPYTQAVLDADSAARAVLARAGRDTCLRGKLTRALLGLSFSCGAGGLRSGLCALADQAVVVTPMTLAFMDQTSRELLALIRGAATAAVPAGPAAESGSVPAPGP